MIVSSLARISLIVQSGAPDRPGQAPIPPGAYVCSPAGGGLGALASDRVSRRRPVRAIVAEIRGSPLDPGGDRGRRAPIGAEREGNDAMSWLADPQIWTALVTLTAMEIVLGIDNLIFIAILVDRLPPEQRASARRLGLALALVTRLLLLLTLSWIIGLTAPLLTVFGIEISWRDTVLIVGGLFLIGKGTSEIHGKLEVESAAGPAPGRASGYAAVLIQVAVMDIVFSLDSVVTAIGMARELAVMVAAIVIAMIVMMAAAGPLGAFVDRHPTVKMLALSFLLLIGTALVADGLDFHIPKGYIYAAMGFSVFVESLNILARRRRLRRAGDG